MILLPLACCLLGHGALPQCTRQPSLSHWPIPPPPVPVPIHRYISADVELDGVAGLREALKQQGTKVGCCLGTPFGCRELQEVRLACGRRLAAGCQACLHALPASMRDWTAQLIVQPGARCSSPTLVAAAWLPISYTLQVSVNDIVIKAAALALAEVPAANSLWDATQEAAVQAGSGKRKRAAVVCAAAVHPHAWRGPCSCRPSPCTAGPGFEHCKGQLPPLTRPSPVLYLLAQWTLRLRWPRRAG